MRSERLRARARAWGRRCGFAFPFQFDNPGVVTGRLGAWHFRPIRQEFSKLNLTNARLVAATLAVALAVALAACATPEPVPVEIRQGTIEQITATQITSNQHAGVGAVVGGLAGVGIGSLIGGGTGRDVAMVAGAIGGALLGNQVQKRNDTPVAAQQIIVRTKSGVLVAVTQPDGPALSVGQKAFIQGYGEGARVTPQ